MAFYINQKQVRLSDKPEQYNRELRPGQSPYSPGIYKCQHCGYEDVINRECIKLPPCAECRYEHTTWKLLVKAVDK